MNFYKQTKSLFEIIQLQFYFRELGKKSALHIADQCLSSFGVSYMFPLNSVYANLLNDLILRISASGLDLKISNDMAWDLLRSDTSALLESTKVKTFSFADVEERKLNLADTEGMFLLMAVGYVTAGSVLVSEIVGGCAQKVRAFIRRKSDVIIQTVRRTSSGCERIEEEDLYVPKSFTDKVLRKIQMTFRRNPIPAKKTKKKLAFEVLKRIILLRKHRNKVEKVDENHTDDHEHGNNNIDGVESNLENVADFSRDRLGEHCVNFQDEKDIASCNASISLESSSTCSDSHANKEEHKAEVNQFLNPGDRDRNPSKEFGEIIK